MTCASKCVRCAKLRKGRGCQCCPCKLAILSRKDTKQGEWCQQEFHGVHHRTEARLARGLSSDWMAFPRNWQQAWQALSHEGTMTNLVRVPCFAIMLGRLVDTSGNTSVSSRMSHSMPNVLDSSTARSSFSWSISNDEYGGKSSLLKQV